MAHQVGPPIRHSHGQGDPRLRHAGGKGDAGAQGQDQPAAHELLKQEEEPSPTVDDLGDARAFSTFDRSTGRRRGETIKASSEGDGRPG